MAEEKGRVSSHLGNQTGRLFVRPGQPEGESQRAVPPEQLADSELLALVAITRDARDEAEATYRALIDEALRRDVLGRRELAALLPTQWVFGTRATDEEAPALAA